MFGIGFGLAALIFRALLILAISFIGIALFRVLEDRARTLDSRPAAALAILLCHAGKVLSVILAVTVVLWKQVVRILEYL